MKPQTNQINMQTKRITTSKTQSKTTLLIHAIKSTIQQNAPSTNKTRTTKRKLITSNKITQTITNKQIHQNPPPSKQL